MKPAIKTTTKTTTDPIAKARKHPKFQQYAQEARARIVLATEIYKAREKQELSQEELARKAETTQKVISKVENGQVNVGVDLLFKILKPLDLKMRVGEVSIR